ncbi:MAG TPA: hypothetical protein VHV08_12600, partial [Pirellulales bacterium]|nr:hypothetical protein [Pirellulales bacterium]
NDGNRQDYAGRMRLRGIFQPASSSDRDLVRQSGGGRWVSLVYSQPDGDPTGASALVVDGQTREGWASPNLDPFFCRPGESSNYTRALTGRRGPLSWRYLLLAPVEFDHSLVLEANAGDKLGDRLALFYLKK